MDPKRTQITRQLAKQIWIEAQRLNVSMPFGDDGAESVARAVAHLGYVQIDTINVIERCHHHILFNRIPKYRRDHLTQAQRDQKSVFEYWTHALAYIPTQDFRFYLRAMRAHQKQPSRWFGTTTRAAMRRVLRLIEREGPLTIRDFTDETLVEKVHPWASKKPSKKALELAFYAGQVVISERHGMLKRYELTNRHFGWPERPRIPSAKAELDYRLDRALRSQGLITLASVAHLEPSAKPAFQELISVRLRKTELIECDVEGVVMWARPSTLAQAPLPSPLTHILSPFDPLVIQRKRLKHLFGYEHRFEAYLPKEQRQFGYFALPVLMEDQIVALLDLKTDREQQKLLIQKWSWIGKWRSPSRRMRIEEELGRFESFQVQREADSKKKLALGNPQQIRVQAALE